MQTLHLHVHNGVRVEGEAVVAAGKVRKAELVPVFYLVHAAQNLAVGDEGVELFELLRMGEVPVAAEKLRL